MVVIATLKQEHGELVAYIRKDGKVEKFEPGTAYYGPWDVGTLTEAVFIAYPTALFVSSDKFDTWDELSEEL